MATVYPFSKGYFQQDNRLCYKGLIISRSLHENDNNFSLLHWPSQAAELKPAVHLSDELQQEVSNNNYKPIFLKKKKQQVNSHLESAFLSKKN